ncbi:type VII secretion protein EsxN [Mycobacterium riyadhense]|uniref:Type VII secretion protein EsxN n=1 Tax=Mycobacterium riyadhense TaxID=486698 RepID=A0A1X2DGJ5_9MYCO|nr:type VII secretion protein EsxN [Mycobacterium riyadhense]VTO96734.1 ESAT-6-like protein EsxI [Mycobacterium riyadhense]
MTDYQFADVEAHGGTIRAQAVSLEAKHQAMVRDAVAAADFWGVAGSAGYTAFVTRRQAGL